MSHTCLLHRGRVDLLHIACEPLIFLDKMREKERERERKKNKGRDDIVEEKSVSFMEDTRILLTEH